MTLRDYFPAIGLGITQIIGYGTLLYAYAVLLPVMAQDLGLPLSTVFGMLSLGLFFGGLFAPVAGMLVDRYGGRYVMTLGSLASGCALIGLSTVEGQYSLFLAVVLAEAASVFVLYNVAFPAATRLDTKVPPTRAISIITLFGGVASTIFWPLTLALETRLGWETTWIILGVMVIGICVPIHYWVLAGPKTSPQQVAQSLRPDWPELSGIERKRGMLWMVVSFVFSGYLMAAIMTLWVTNVQDLGHTAAAAAIAGAVIGPFKTVGRGLEMLLSRNMYPLVTYALAIGLMMSGFAVLLTFGFSFVGIIVAAALYGMGDGIKTIARGTLPLALFGRKGYGARLGWISFVQMGINASAPFAFAWVTEVYGGWASFASMAAVLAVAITTYFLIPDPRRKHDDASQDRRMSDSS